MASVVLLCALAGVALLAPLIERYPPGTIELDTGATPPSLAHWFGTDRLGRDVWSRTLHAARVSLAVGIVAAAVAAGIGTCLGCVAGFAGGLVDSAIMRVVDLLMALPAILILLVLVAYVGPGLINLFILLPLLSWMGSCRLMRAQVLSVRERDYVLAARCLGCSTRRILTVHVLSNAFPPVLVSVTLGVGGMILSESGLSFLGLGVQPPTPTWGNMLSEVTSLVVLRELPWTWLPPGLLIVMTILAVNFIGDGLRDAIDPHTAVE